MRIVNDLLRLTASDLVNHLACRHLTRVDFEVASRQREAPDFHDPTVEMLQKKGDAHEQDYIEHLREAGHQVTVIDGVGLDDVDVVDTLRAMREGHEIIVQGSLVQGRWGGRADILRRTPVSSSLGDWSYEVIDTKLARETKAGTILQLSLYSDLVREVQGVLPEYMYVVTPWTEFEPQKFRTNDYAAYYRLIKNRLELYFDADQLGDTYPDPRDHCRICRWRDHCGAVRINGDHVSLVAGISNSQIGELRRHGITQVADLAGLSFPVSWITRSATAARFEKLGEQARVQMAARGADPVRKALIPEDFGIGLAGIPEPSEGDMFLAFERAPFVGPTGIQLLLGFLTMNESGVPEYAGLWAVSEAQEKQAFESFVDSAIKQWESYPDLHLYHYGRSSLNTMMRLSGRHSTREAEIETLLRAGLMVNLYPVVRDGVVASVEQYTLEELEQFYGFTRSVPVDDAGEATRGISSTMELAYPGEVSDIDDRDKRTVQAYNNENCRSVFHLREWLEGLRSDLINQGEIIERPVLQGSWAGGPETETQRIIERLNQGIPVKASERNLEQNARWVLTNILNWHWKEEVAAREEFARLVNCSSEELLDETRALAQLERVGLVGRSWGSPVYRYSFPAQETSFGRGEELYGRGGAKVGEVESIDFQGPTVDIKTGPFVEDFNDGDVIGFANIPLNALKESLRDLGGHVARHGMEGEGEYNLARNLLLRNHPHLGGDPVLEPSETALEAALRIAHHEEFGVLPVQGPPGSGKTYLGAQMICELVRLGARVGVTGNSHRVIINLLDEVVKIAEQQGLDVGVVRRSSGQDDEAGDPRILVTRYYDEVLDGLCSDRQVAAGTAWMWSRPDFQECVDVLFVDEAAQMTLANVLASSRAARNLVLLGDPQQLNQPVRGNHPEGIDVSALRYLLDGRQTIGNSEGLFLPETLRLHPHICAFTSEVFYESRLVSCPGLERQEIVSSGPVSGSGLRFVPVEHVGNRTSSDEEVTVVTKLVSSLLEAGSSWIDHEGRENLLRWEDVLIVAPYNSQVNRIQERLPEASVGTVDKFQGQEAPVVIYSMGASSPLEAPRGLEFLYSLNRLNVATSRARCICILVASPEIFEPECRTPREIQLANALCRYREMAAEIHI